MFPRQKYPVLRVTVDRRDGDQMVRLLWAPLAQDHREFADELDDWGEEEATYLTQDTYAKWLGVAPAALSWSELKEGRVYVVGAFRGVTDGADENGPIRFELADGVYHCQRIDNLEWVKRESKKVYSTLLEREGRS